MGDEARRAPRRTHRRPEPQYAGGFLIHDTRLQELNRLIAGWPGLVASPDPGLIIDSLVLVDLLQGDERLVDVGSGAGLPGLVLKLARPELDLVLIEANQRKTAFLADALARLDVRGARVVARRAEDAGRDPGLRETFDVATARALAPMNILVELCLPLVRPGGRLLAMKVDAETEVAEAETAIRLLGGRLREIRPAPTAARARGQVVVVDKMSPTPPGYPRPPGVPRKRPLGA